MPLIYFRVKIVNARGRTTYMRYVTATRTTTTTCGIEQNFNKYIGKYCIRVLIKYFFLYTKSVKYVRKISKDVFTQSYEIYFIYLKI